MLQGSARTCARRSTCFRRRRLLHPCGESAAWIGAGNGSRTRDPQLGKVREWDRRGQQGFTSCCNYSISRGRIVPADPFRSNDSQGFCFPLATGFRGFTHSEGRPRPPARLHRDHLPALHHRRAAPLPRRCVDPHPRGGPCRIPSQVALLLSLKPLQQRPRRQHHDAEALREVPRVARHQRVGLAGQCYL